VLFGTTLRWLRVEWGLKFVTASSVFILGSLSDFASSLSGWWNGRAGIGACLVLLLTSAVLLCDGCGSCDSVFETEEVV
jgi:hypothetical protein